MLSTEKIIEIANQYGTPIYILDKEHLGKRIHDIQTILGNDITLCYAMKANPFLVDALILNMRYVHQESLQYASVKRLTCRMWFFQELTRKKRIYVMLWMTVAV